ncbi:MAG: MaoC family dehydratase N-terminal domain-containing protein [Actinomycetia bacterium]|nr:MaoC family dehydratase N-terminal domain-containing protein [Actinomycetes bacterium]MCH9801142.1 MaoC family dehydratase N-terminal domain-containing protein [Actinomycetes bacterium]
MPLDHSYLGKEYPTTPAYQVGREHIRDYAAAIGDLNPAYHNVDAARELGHRDLIAPPTYPFTLTMRAMTTAVLDPDLGLHYGQVVHGEQSFDYVRPVTAGDELVVQARIAAIEVKGINELLTTECRVETVTGELVVTTREVIVSRGTAV